VPEEEVVNMNRRLAAPDHSLNAPLRVDGEGEWQDWLVDESPTRKQKLAESRRDPAPAPADRGDEGLNERERHILMQRRLQGRARDARGPEPAYGISRERVRQIEVRAFEKLQKAMKNMVVEAAARPPTRPAVEAAGAR
jgi:RNA polymerase sigma-32 factor